MGATRSAGRDRGAGQKTQGAGPALQGVGPALQGVGPALQGVGPALQGVGPALQGVGTALLQGAGDAIRAPRQEGARHGDVEESARAKLGAIGLNGGSAPKEAVDLVRRTISVGPLPSAPLMQRSVSAAPALKGRDELRLVFAAYLRALERKVAAGLVRDPLALHAFVANAVTANAGCLWWHMNLGRMASAHEAEEALRDVDLSKLGPTPPPQGRLVRGIRTLAVLVP